MKLTLSPSHLFTKSLKLLQGLIIVFWLATTTRLILHAYFPEESRFPIVAREHVAELFFKDPKSSDMAILRDGENFGQLSVSARKEISKSPDFLENPEGLREIFFNGFIAEKKTALDPVSIANWSGSLFVDERFGLHAVRLQLRIPRTDVDARAVLTMDPPDVRYEIKQGQNVLLDSANPKGVQEVFDELEKLGGKRAEWLDISRLGNPDELLRWIMAFEPKIDCRHGRFELLGEKHEGYIIKLIFLDAAHIKFCFSELGELVLVDGLPKVEIVGEAFAPEEDDPIK